MAIQLAKVVKRLFLEALNEIISGNGVDCPCKKTKYEEGCIESARDLKCYGGLECSNLIKEMLEQFSSEGVRIYFTDVFLPKLGEMPEELLADVDIKEKLKGLYKAAIIDELIESRKKAIFFSEVLMGAC